MSNNPYQYETERNQLLETLSRAAGEIGVEERDLYEWTAKEGLRGLAENLVLAIRRKIFKLSEPDVNRTGEFIQYLEGWLRESGVEQSKIDQWRSEKDLMGVASGILDTKKRVVKRVRVQHEEDLMRLFAAIADIKTPAGISRAELENVYKKRGVRAAADYIRETQKKANAS